MDEDRDLIVRLRAGEAAAFEQLVRLHTPRLLAAARRILRNEEDARDAVQNAFLSAFRSLHSFKGDARLSTWLHRIGINAALMLLRRKNARPLEMSVNALLPHFQDDGHQADPAAPWVPVENLLELQETRAFVRQSIDQLPESHRTVLLLRDIEGLDTEQTAEQLGVSVGVVKTRLHRARQALRALLDGHFRGGAYDVP